MKISNQIHPSLLGRIASIVNDPRRRSLPSDSDFRNAAFGHLREKGH